MFIKREKKQVVYKSNYHNHPLNCHLICCVIVLRFRPCTVLTPGSSNLYAVLSLPLCMHRHKTVGMRRHPSTLHLESAEDCKTRKVSLNYFLK